MAAVARVPLKTQVGLVVPGRDGAALSRRRYRTLPRGGQRSSARLRQGRFRAGRPIGQSLLWPRGYAGRHDGEHSPCVFGLSCRRTTTGSGPERQGVHASCKSRPTPPSAASGNLRPSVCLAGIVPRRRGRSATRVRARSATPDRSRRPETSSGRRVGHCEVVSAQMPGEEPQRAVHFEQRHIAVLPGIGVQRLLHRGQGVEQRQALLPRHHLVVPLDQELHRHGDP